MDICCTKPQFALAFFEEKLPGISCLEIPDDPRGTIRRAVIDHNNMIPLPQSKNSLQDISYIFFFVIRRYDDDLFQNGLYMYVQNYNFYAPYPLSQPFFNIALLNISVSFCLVCRGKSPFIIQS